jgi:hypothetical protein
MKLRKWQEAFQGPSLSLLLGAQIVFIFLIVPLVATGVLSRLWVSGFQLLLAFVSVFVFAGVGLTRLVIASGFALMLATSSHRSPSIDETLLHSAGLFLFLTAVTWGIARVVFTASDVTHHQVQGAVVVYLNLALIFTTIFEGIVLLHPTSFAQIPVGAGHQFGPLLYFSLCTLTTTCYGDIVPVHPMARSLASLEAVAGQIYLTTLLARLVSLHVAHRKNGDGNGPAD